MELTAGQNAFEIGSDELGACSQGHEDLGDHRVKRGHAVLEHAIVGGEPEALGLRDHQRRKTAVLELDALGFALSSPR